MPLRGEQGAADLHRVIIRAGKAAAGDMPGVVIQESQIEADVMADNRLDGGTAAGVASHAMNRGSTSSIGSRSAPSHR